MPAAMPGKKSDFAPFERAQHESVGGLAEGSLNADLADLGQSRHGI
jgi:hypothetical protein